MNMFNVPINAALNSYTILFFVFLLIIYLTKKNAYKVDNLIYKKLLLWNATDLIFHFAFIIAGAYYKVDNTIVIYSAKLFLTFYTLFINYLCINIIVVCNQNNKKFTTLYGDSDKVRIIINNIISNSIKYTDEGIIDFSVDSMNYKGEANLVISVTDTGRCISDEQMQQMFTKFYRRDEDKDSDIEGTGLGLALTKSLVELM